MATEIEHERNKSVHRLMLFSRVAQQSGSANLLRPVPDAGSSCQRRDAQTRRNFSRRLPNKMIHQAYRNLQKCVALALVLFLSVGTVCAGVTVTGANGITMTGADGVTYVNTSGITMTGADGLLACGVNGITMTGADGITMTGADGVTYTGANGVTATRANGITMTGADGITMTGADGITMTGADGTTYQADSVVLTKANGITMTGADGITMTGADGVVRNGTNGITMTGADGITMTGADGITMTGADGITMTGADGSVSTVPNGALRFAGVDGITMTGADGITMTGADGLNITTVNSVLPNNGQSVGDQAGLQSLDPELALLLDRATDDSSVNAVVVYHHQPTSYDLSDLQRLGVLGGTTYSWLPMVVITATRAQIIAISHLPAVRSIYGNRTLQLSIDTNARNAMNLTRTQSDLDLSRANGGTQLTGKGVTVAVLDTGIDGTHTDLVGRVAQNVKLVDTQSAAVGFLNPTNVENLPNTDQAHGHGTFVAGVIAGSGARSAGKYAGVAPQARVVGLSAGDLTLTYVLNGFDYILSHNEKLNVRIVNCSFSANTVFDLNDPVNVATRILTDNGINVVFSAGNDGPGANTLNPYAAAPWVVSVGATDNRGRLASFSSRGAFGSALFHPTLVAPGVNSVSLRAAGVNLTGTDGITSATDTSILSPTELPFYTVASGTSFSAPEVAGTIALMLQANPNLTPAQVRDILARTATPLTPYFAHEVGAGMLNSHAAVLEAAFPQRRMGMFRAVLDRGQAHFTNDPVQEFGGSVSAGGGIYETTLNVPEHAFVSSVQIAWGPPTNTNDLALALFDPNGTRSPGGDTINQAGLTGHHESVSTDNPQSGAWRVRVTNGTSTLTGTAQSFAGTFEVTRVEYPQILDLDSLSVASREEAYHAMQIFAMSPYSLRFRPNFSVSRFDLASALLMSARVPQYLPGQPSYTDVRDDATRIAIESAQAAPGGPLFTDATAGSAFRPFQSATRLIAAVALVRAAGLGAEAEAANRNPQLEMPPAEVAAIPVNLRGYVAVAISYGLITTETGFRSSSPLTRAELAHALSVINNMQMH